MKVKKLSIYASLILIGALIWKKPPAIAASPEESITVTIEEPEDIIAKAEEEMHEARTARYDDSNFFDENTVIATRKQQENALSKLLKLGIEVDSSKLDNYLLLNAITKNKNLSEEEKTIFYKYIDYFNDYPILNKESTYRRILNVDTMYSKENSVIKEAYHFSDFTKAAYIRGENEEINMIVYLTDSVDREDIGHELGHVIDEVNNLPTWMKESLDELRQNEYISEDPYKAETTYPIELPLKKLLCELVGSDTVIKTECEGDINILYKSLSEIAGTIEDAKATIEPMNDITVNKLKNKEMSEDETNNITRAVDNLEAYIIIKEKNTKVDMSDAYTHHSNMKKLINADDLSIIISDIERNSNVKKPYLSSKLIEKYNTKDALISSKVYQK